ncbi:MAG: phosphomannomutase/phosphoglucomutase [Chromatiales bacterium]|nr:phosphomannomutase/phosphoglucomutase [Chromatiales bacterium]
MKGIRFSRKRPAPAAAAQRLRARTSVARVAFSTFVLTALLFVLLGMVLQWLNAREHERVQDDAARAIAVAVAQQVSDSFGLLAGNAAQLAADPLAVVALRDGSPAALAQAEQQLAARAVQVGRVHLLPPEVGVTPDRAAGDWFGYAAVDLARRAQRGATPPFEVHLYGESTRRVVVARPVRDGGKPIGSLLLMYPFDYLKSAVVAPAGAGLPVAIVQGESNELVRTTAGSVRGAARNRVDIPGTSWSVAWGSLAARESVAELLLFWGALVAALLLIGLATYLQFAQLRRHIRADGAGIVGIFDDALRLRLHENYPVRLTEFTPAYQQLRDRAREYVVKRRKSQRAAPESDAMPAIEAPALDLLEEGDFDPVRMLPVHVLRDSAICGLADEFVTPEGAFLIGQAVGSEAYERGQNEVFVARDVRESSAVLADALIRGLRKSGRTAIDLGVVPAPLLYYATLAAKPETGVMVGGGNSPPEFNGFEVVLRGELLTADALQSLRGRAVSKNLLTGDGALRNEDLGEAYIQRVVQDVALASRLRVVVDAGNGATGALAERLYRALGCDVVLINGETDPAFPARGPDVGVPAHMASLVRAIGKRRADLGLAFDAAGNRLLAVDKLGNAAFADRVLILFAYDILAANPGSDVVFDPLCSRYVPTEVVSSGGRPVLANGGFAAIHERMRATKAPLGGSFDGRLLFGDRWFGLPDALYAGARLLELLSADDRGSADFFAQAPQTASTPEFRIAFDEGEVQEFIAALEPEAHLPGARITRDYGIKIELPRGWGVVRPCEATPCIGIRFEADNAQALGEIAGRFKAMLIAANPHLPIPF